MNCFSTEIKRVRHEKGKTIYEDVTIYPLISSSGEGEVIRIDDVTEQVRIEEMMVQSEKMLSVGGARGGHGPRDKQSTGGHDAGGRKHVKETDKPGTPC